jgi:aminoglycoside 3-N-acetyltransferase
VLGAGGTLLMPALSYETVRSANPVFDVRATPSCVGALPEYFRTRPGTRRSVHPTHSVCGAGPRTAEMLSDHERSTTPVVPFSPFRRLRDVAARCSSSVAVCPNTSMHGVEELVEPPICMPMSSISGGAENGTQRMMRLRRHNFSGWEQRYDRLGPLIQADGLRVGPVLAATAHLVEAALMWEVAYAALRRAPLYFVDKTDT